MFRALARKVFNTSNKMDFYNSILEREALLLNNQNQPSQLIVEDESEIQLPTEQLIRERYYDYLFGKADNKIKSDDLSIYITEQIKLLLVDPADILESMPVLPASLSQVLPHIRDKNFDAEELVSLLQQEPVVAARVIELANSTKYNRSNKEVSDLKTAFLMLGVSGLSEGVINGFIHRLVPQNNLYFRFYGKRIWESSLLTGEITKSLLKKSKYTHLADEGYLLGLISNLGDIIIYQLLADAFNFVHPDCQPNSKLFRESVKNHSKRFSHVLAKNWQFPKLLTDSLALQTKIESSKQAKANIQQHPLAIYLYEARLLTKLKLQLTHGQISKTELVSMVRQLSVSIEAVFVIEDIINEFSSLKPA